MTPEPSLRCLDKLRCPETGEALNLIGGRLRSHSGREYPIVGGIPRFHGLVDTTEPRLKKTAKRPEKWSSWRRACYQWLEKEIAPFPPKLELLDLGAGPSHFTSLMEPFEVTAVDFAPYPDIDVITDLNKPLPFLDETFDLVLLSNVLEHIPQPHMLTGEVRRILRDGGTALMMTPFVIKLHQTPYDFLRYTRYMFEHLFRQANFGEWEITPIGSAAAVGEQGLIRLRKTQRETTPSGWRRRAFDAGCWMENRIGKWNDRMAGVADPPYDGEETFPQGYGCRAVR